MPALFTALNSFLDRLRPYTRSRARHLAQRLEDARVASHDLHPPGEHRRVVAREHLPHAASHALVDYLCAATGQDGEHRRSEDMRRVEILFEEHFRTAAML